jgi:hypothetical protein
MPFHLKPGRGRCTDCKILYNLRWLVTLDRKRVCFPSCNFNASKLLKMEGETWGPVKVRRHISLTPTESMRPDFSG